MSNQNKAQPVPQRYQHPQQPNFLQRPPTPRATDYHVQAQQQYGQPPTQAGGNQGSPNIRAGGMAPAGPPTQSSTPPTNNDLKVAPVPQMNLVGFNTYTVPPQAVRSSTQNYFPRGPPQQSQTQRMAPNHRQVQQQPVYPPPQNPGPPYVQMQQQAVPPMYAACLPFYNAPRALVPQIFQGQYAFTYPASQPTQSQYFSHYLSRPQAPVVVPQTLQQQQPLPGMTTNVPQNMQQTGSSQKKRERPPNAIPIIDPNTGEDKLNDIYDGAGSSHPASAESSARQTPQLMPMPMPNKEIQNTFTKQVNMALNQDKMKDIDHSSVPVTDHQQQQHHHLDAHSPMQTVAFQIPTIPPLHSSNIPMRNDSMQFTKLQVPQKEFIPASATIVKESTPVVSANADVPELTINKQGSIKDRESPAKNRKQRDHAPKEKESKEPAVVHQMSLQDKQQQQQQQQPQQQLQQQHQQRPKEDTVKPPQAVVKEEVKPKEPTIALITPPPFSKDVSGTAKEVLLPAQRDEKKNLGRKDKSEPTKFNPVQEVVSEHGAAPPVCAPIVDNSKAKQKNAPKQQPPTQQQQQRETAFNKPSIPPVVPQTQPPKQNNKTNKMKELNMKGANKEGTDMDAFSDNHAPPSNEPQQPLPQQPLSQQPLSQQQNVRCGYNANSAPAAPTVTVPAAPVDIIADNNSSSIPPTPVVVETVDSNKLAEPEVPAMPPTATITIESSTNNKPTPKAKIDVTDIVKEVPKPFVAPLPVDITDRMDKSDLNEKLVQAKNEVNIKNNSSDLENSNAGDIRQKLTYKDDQWSPFNQDGKKVYGKDFLLALKDDPKSRKKPDNLLDVVLQEDRGRVGDISRYPYAGIINRAPDFAPQFTPNYPGKSTSRGGGGGTKRGSQASKISGNSKNNKVEVVRVSLHKDVKLNVTENAWKPARLTSSAEKPEEDKKTDILYKKVRGILNKLTPQKFDSLLKQIKRLEIDTSERLQGVIDLVFEKAVDEPNFSVSYANMCSEVALIQVPANNKKEGEYVNFRKLLVTRCQREFEKNSQDEKSRNKLVQEIVDCTDPEKKKELQLTLEEEDRRLRRKSVGNIRFIGELFKRNMLTSNIMMRCLDNLLTNKDEESLECLCKLLSTVGEELEKRKVNLDNIFSTVKEIADRKHGKISSRVRFMLQDVLDLRAAKWVPRRQDANPKTIDQIQQEANDEQLNIQAMNSGPHTPRKDDRSGSSSSSNDKKQPRRNNISDNEGWTTSQTRGGRTSFTVQSDKLKNKPPLNDEPLGCSQMFGQWGRGSILKTNPPSSLGNMYAPLENMGNDIEKRTSISTGYKSKDTYTSKGPSLERNYNKHSPYEDGRGSRSGSQHRSHNGSQRATSISSSSSAQASMPKQMAPPLPNVVAPAVASQPSSQQPPSNKIPQLSNLTPEQLELKIKNNIDEYLTDSSTIEACEEEIRDSIPEAAYTELVSLGYNHILERSSTSRLKLAHLFAYLIKRERLSLDIYCLGLEDVLSQADDLTIDIPMIWDYLAELIAPLLYENTLPLKRLHKSCSVLISQGHAARLLAPIFKLVMAEKGPNFLASAWKASELSLSNFMPAEKVNDFIKDNKLECLVGGETTVSCSSGLSYEQIHNKLLDFLNNDNSFDDIVNWVNVNVGERAKENQFIRVLTTAIFEHSIVKMKLQVDALRKHYHLFNYFVASNIEYELQVLYALQAYVNKLEVPQGLYLLAFSTLYDDAVLSHDSFLKWEASTDPAEHDGKGVALKQLTSFFTNMKEGDEDSSSTEEA